MLVSWKEVPGAEYYQLQYSDRKNFKKRKMRPYIRKKKATVYLKAKQKKKYYFHVRAYKKVSNKRVYGEWSKTVMKRCK